jgi:hypothetical protein
LVKHFSPLYNTTPWRIVYERVLTTLSVTIAYLRFTTKPYLVKNCLRGSPVLYPQQYLFILPIHTIEMRNHRQKCNQVWPDNISLTLLNTSQLPFLL